MFVYSPTNMAMYRQCPAKFKAYIDGKLPYRQTKQKERGIKVHDSIERIVKEGLKEANYLPSGVNARWTLQQIEDLLTSSKQGDIYVEHDLCVTEDMKVTGWKDDNCWLRARADTIVVYPDRVHIIDYKTGRKWDTDYFQLSIEALLAHVIYRKNFVEFEYWYVDQGVTDGNAIDFSKGLDGVRFVLDTIKDMKNSFKSKSFYAKQNKFCKWCEVRDTCNIFTGNDW